MLTDEEINQIKQQLSEAIPSKENSEIENKLDDIAFTIQTEYKAIEERKKIVEMVKSLIKEKKSILDTRIIIYLTESLLHNFGFKGLNQGLSIANLFVDNWDKIYPGSDESKKSSFENMNNFSEIIQAQPLTDPQNTRAYSYFQYQLSRRVGYEKDTRDQYQNIIDEKRAEREANIANNWPTAEEYDEAEERSISKFYIEMSEDIEKCLSEIETLDKNLMAINKCSTIFSQDNYYNNITGEKTKGMKEALLDYQSFAKEILESRENTDNDTTPDSKIDKNNDKQATKVQKKIKSIHSEPIRIDIPETGSNIELSDVSDPERIEAQLWESIYNDALSQMKKIGVQQTIKQLNFKVSKSSSTRHKSYYKFIIAKICFNANKIETANKIFVELYTEIKKKNLIEWDSHFWISEVFYLRCKCLLTGEPTNDDIQTVRNLFDELCKIDVTKSIVLEDDINKKGVSIRTGETS